MDLKDSASGLPPTVVNLIDKLARLPGVGRKSAQRMAMHILRSPREYAADLADCLLAVKDKVAWCHTCWMLSESNPCPLCAESRRDHRKVCVVEESGDVIAIEKTGVWNGLYHVLGGAISPLDGVGPEQLRLSALLERCSDGAVEEVVVATNPTAEGETTALYIARMFKGSSVRVTRIARGVPVGSDLELVDETTLQQSMQGRTEISNK